VRRKQQLHDAQPGLGSDRGEHVGIPGHLIGILASSSHISIFAETWTLVKRLAKIAAPGR
jgi:hypothetical protein